MRIILLLLLLLVACEKESITQAGKPVEVQQIANQVAPRPIDRTIKRIPLGDERLITGLADNWSLESENDLLSELVAANQEIAVLPLTQAEVPRLDVNNEFIPEYATGLKTAYQEYGSKDQLYTVLKTIWRTEDLHIVLAGTKALENEGLGLAQRTDLLVLKDNNIVDGVTVYYSLSEFSWGAKQLFYIDENKQIWLQRFVNDEEGIQTMESLSLAILPNGRIRALTGLISGE